MWSMRCTDCTDERHLGRIGSNFMLCPIISQQSRSHHSPIGVATTAQQHDDVQWNQVENENVTAPCSRHVEERQRTQCGVQQRALQGQDHIQIRHKTSYLPPTIDNAFLCKAQLRQQSINDESTNQSNCNTSLQGTRDGEEILRSSPCSRPCTRGKTSPAARRLPHPRCQRSPPQIEKCIRAPLP